MQGGVPPVPMGACRPREHPEEEGTWVSRRAGDGEAGLCMEKMLDELCSIWPHDSFY